MKKLLFILLALASSYTYAETPAKVSPTDALLELVVEKARLYSDKGEMVISKGVDFVMAQAEPTVKEFITWRIISHTIDALPSIAFCVISGMSLLVFNFIWPRDLWGSDFPTRWCVVCVISVIFFIIGFFGVFVGPPERGGTSAITDLKLAAQAYYAPRVYIIEQTAEFIKKNK
jgi:hypothetical protein